MPESILIVFESYAFKAYMFCISCLSRAFIAVTNKQTNKKDIEAYPQKKKKAIDGIADDLSSFFSSLFNFSLSSTVSHFTSLLSSLSSSPLQMTFLLLGFSFFFFFPKYLSLRLLQKCLYKMYIRSIGELLQN